MSILDDGYNVKIFEYVDGGQVRRYKRNIKKLTDEEKEKNKERRERDKQLFAERKISNDFNPFYDGPCELWEDEPKDVSYLLERSQRDLEHSVENSINRTKNHVYQLARSNLWDWFFTFTFNPKKVDSMNYDETTKALSNWLSNLRKRLCPNIGYIVVPELHKKGGYHFHGLFNNCDELEFEDSGHRTKDDNIIYHIANYGLGFTTATRIGHSAKACGYFTKYMTKELFCTTKGKKRYWSSKNLNKPKEYLYDMTDEQFYNNILEPYDDYLSTSKSILIGSSETDVINHVSYYEFSNEKV